MRHRPQFDRNSAIQFAERGLALYVSAMNLKQKKGVKVEVPFDPVLFAATVPSRKPSEKDRADAAERPDDAIEPRNYETMDDTVEDL